MLANTHYHVFNGGFNPMALIALRVVSLNPNAVPGFMDAWLSNDGGRVTVLTRSGGVPEHAAANLEMMQWPGFVEEKTSKVDPHFVEFRYEVPERYRDETKWLAEFMSSILCGEETNGPAAMWLRVRGKLPDPVIPSTDIIEKACDRIEKLARRVWDEKRGELHAAE